MVRRIPSLLGRATGAMVVASVLVVLSACAPQGGTAGSPSPSTTGPPVLEGSFEVEDGRSLALKCSGEGAPTAIYDAGTGSSGIEALRGALPVKALASSTRVCTYDRAGTGASDPAPDRVRTVDDLVDDLHALLAAADIAPPYILVGSSGGGFDIYHYAGRHPDDVAGLVMDDVPSPQAAIPASDVPAWDAPDNPEHMDYVLFERQLAVDRLPIPAIPVTVLWATHGQSATQADQDLWLEGSSDPQSIAVESGHDIMHGDPGAVADAIEQMLASIRG
jgi:pimeloyl-ACP methyl ester carboxylesterase